MTERSGHMTDRSVMWYGRDMETLRIAGEQIAYNVRGEGEETVVMLRAAAHARGDFAPPPFAESVFAAASARGDG